MDTESGDTGSQPVEAEVSEHGTEGREAGSPPAAQAGEPAGGVQRTSRSPETEQRIRTLVRKEKEALEKVRKYEEDFGLVERGEHAHVKTHVEKAVREHISSAKSELNRYLADRGVDLDDFWGGYNKWVEGFNGRGQQAPAPQAPQFSPEDIDKRVEARLQAALAERDSRARQTEVQQRFDSDVRKVVSESGITNPRFIGAVKQLASEMINEDWQKAQELGEKSLPKPAAEYIKDAVRELATETPKLLKFSKPPVTTTPSSGRGEAKSAEERKMESIRRHTAGLT